MADSTQNSRYNDEEDDEEEEEEEIDDSVFLTRNHVEFI